MSEIRQTGSPDQCLPSHAAGDHDDPCDGEMLTLCDSGRSEACTGVPTVLMSVPYLREGLHLCQACAVYEARHCGDEPILESARAADPLRGDSS